MHGMWHEIDVPRMRMNHSRMRLMSGEMDVAFGLAKCCCAQQEARGDKDKQTAHFGLGRRV